MAIGEREWESVYAAIKAAQAPDEFIEGIVVDHDADGRHVYLTELGAEPIPVVGLDYQHTIYTGELKNIIRSEPVLPAIGERVLVARTGGSRHRPRVVGVIRNGETGWKQPSDIQVLGLGGDAFFDDLSVNSLQSAGIVRSSRGAIGDDAFAALVNGDSTSRFVIDADGRLEWGDGGAGGRDTNLYRIAGSHLKSDDSLEIGGNLILPTVSATIPATPVDGQIWVYEGSDFSWTFRYNGGSASSFKWEFIGGGEMHSMVDTSQVRTGTSVYGDLTTPGPALALPFAGDYFFRYGFQGTTDAVNQAGWMTPDGTGLAAADMNGVRVGGNFPAHNVWRQHRFNGLSAATYTMKFRVTNGANQATFSDRMFIAIPVRVG